MKNTTACCPQPEKLHHETLYTQKNAVFTESVTIAPQGDFLKRIFMLPGQICVKALTQIQAQEQQRAHRAPKTLNCIDCGLRAKIKNKKIAEHPVSFSVESANQDTGRK